MPTLSWIGKEKVMTHHHDVPFRVLNHKYGFRSSDPDDKSYTGSGNMIIHGDNLLALKSLLPQYEGRINCIYIDPPYNTGEEKWVYNDNVNDPHILKWLGEVVGKEGEDLSRHDKWLCMMYPRLSLLRQLLHQDGAIFISIDDNEYANLKAICDDIFGKHCFVANISWQRTYSPRNDKEGVAAEAEHLLVYGKEPNWVPKRLERTDEMDARYSNPDNDERLWKDADATAPGASDHQGMVYAIQQPITGKLLYPTNGRHWTFGQEQMLAIMNEWADYELRAIDDFERRRDICGTEEVPKTIPAIMLKNESTGKEKAKTRYKVGKWPILFFSSKGEGGMVRKTYLDSVEGKIVTNLWPYLEVGHTDEAKKELKEIFGGKTPFDTPKPVRLLERIISIATDDNSIILDSFAGSGTTAHAVLSLNKKNHSNRKFILVELMDYADDTTAFRVKQASCGYKATLKHDELIYRKKLSAKNLIHATEYLNEAYTIAELEKGNYAEVSQPKVSDNCIVVSASRVSEGRVEGLSGQFDYYEIGNKIFKDDGNLNEVVGEDAIREYIFYSETKSPLKRAHQQGSYILDNFGGTGYYFYYEKDAITTLSIDTLSIVTEKADNYIIYADLCTLPETYLAKHNIVFKKIPRDIKQF